MSRLFVRVGGKERLSKDAGMDIDRWNCRSGYEYYVLL